MNSTQSAFEPKLTQDELAARFKLAAIGVLSPENFNELWAQWQEQNSTSFNSTLESSLVDSRFIRQEDWDRAALLILSSTEAILADRIAAAPSEPVAPLNPREQADHAYRAGQVGIDPDIILVSIEAGVPILHAVEQVETGNATFRAANRRILEDYLALYAPELWYRRPVIRRLIAKYDFENLSQAQEFPAFDDMVAKGVAVSAVAIAIVAGGDIVKIAADARAIININGGTAVFNSFVGRLLLNVLPELGCEGHEGAK